MFGLFKKKTQAEKLQLKYQKLMEESYKLSTVNRKQSDDKMTEANNVLEQIDRLKADQ